MSWGSTRLSPRLSLCHNEPGWDGTGLDTTQLWLNWINSPYQGFEFNPRLIQLPEELNQWQSLLSTQWLSQELIRLNLRFTIKTYDSESAHNSALSYTKEISKQNISLYVFNTYDLSRCNLFEWRLTLIKWCCIQLTTRVASPGSESTQHAIHALSLQLNRFN